jgi:hypothetical protein
MSRVFAYAPVKIYFCIGDSQSVESAVLGNGGDSMYKRLVTHVYVCHKPLPLIAYVWQMPY